MRDEDSLSQVSSSGIRGKWIDWEVFWMQSLIEFVNRLDKDCKRKRRVKMIFRFLVYKSGE